MPHTPINEALRCRECGQVGKYARRDNGGIVVTCDGRNPLEGVCCETAPHISPQEAAEQWLHMHVSPKRLETGRLPLVPTEKENDDEDEDTSHYSRSRYRGYS